MTLFLSHTGSRQGAEEYQQLGRSFTPSTGQVVSAGIQAGFQAEGSTSQDVATSIVAEELGKEDQLGVFQKISQGINWATFGSMTPDEVGTIKSEPLSETDWKASKYYREDLKYEEGMTTLAAGILASTRDRKAERDFIYQQASRAQSVGYFSGALVGSMLDAKALAAGVATAGLSEVAVGTVALGRAGMLTADMVRFAPQMGRVAIRSSRALRVGTLAAESAVSTVPSVVTGLQNAPIIQQAYTEEDMALELLASVGLSALFDFGGRALSSTWKRYGRSRDVMEVGQIAHAQVSAGEKIDVAPVVQHYVAGIAPEVHSRGVEPFPGRGDSVALVRAVTQRIRDVGGEVDEKALAPEIQAIEVSGLTDVEYQRALNELVDSRSPDPVVAAKQLGYQPASVSVLEKAVASKRVLAEEERAIRLSDTPELQAAEYALREAKKALKNAPKRGKAAAQKAVEKARLQLDQAHAANKSAAPAKLEVLQRRREEIDRTIRDVQHQEATRRMPEYVQKQLDPSREARAERSIDPRAAEVEADRLEPVKYDEAAPVSQPETEKLRKMVEDGVLTEGDVKFADSLDASPEAIRQYVKCRAGL